MNRTLVKVKGKNIHNFLLKMARNKIEILDAKKVFENEVQVLVKSECLDLIFKNAGIYECEVIEEKGYKSLKKSLLANIYIIIFIIINVFLVSFISKYIYKIEIIENNQNLKTKVEEILSEKGIKKYARKPNNLDVIKKEILSENKDLLEWIEIIPSGVKYIVKLEERIKNDDVHDESPTNIVAKKDGIIKKIVASKGKILVEKETYVKAGDILIGGEIDQDNFVSAKGTVFAETWLRIKVGEPIYEKKFNKTDQSKKGFRIKIFDKELSFYKKYEFNEIKENVIIKSHILPIYISYDTIFRLDYIDHIKTYEEALEAALEKARMEVKKNLKEDEKIISENQLKVEAKDSKIILDMLFTIYENISIEERIEAENVSRNTANSNW